MGKVVMMSIMGAKSHSTVAGVAEAKYVTSNKVYSNTHFSGLNNHYGCGARGESCPANQPYTDMILSNKMFIKKVLHIFF